MSPERCTGDVFPCNPREQPTLPYQPGDDPVSKQLPKATLIAPHHLGHKSREKPPRDALRSLPRRTPPTSLFICKCHLLPPAGVQPAAGAR